MSKLAAAKTVAEIGQIVTGTFAFISDRIRKISDMDGRIKKLEDAVTELKVPKDSKEPKETK
jgi:hypothetical protein